MKKKIIIGVVCGIVLLVAGYFGYAYGFHQHLVATYSKDMEYLEEDGYWTKKGDNIYSLYLRSWWNICGQLGITSTMRIKDGELIDEWFSVNIDLVQAQFSGEYQARIVLHYRAEDGTIKRIHFLLDEHMQLADPENATNVQKQVLEEQRDWIREIYQKVYDLWGILDPNADVEE